MHLIQKDSRVVAETFLYSSSLDIKGRKTSNMMKWHRNKDTGPCEELVKMGLRFYLLHFQSDLATKDAAPEEIYWYFWGLLLILMVEWFFTNQSEAGDPNEAAAGLSRGEHLSVSGSK